MGRFDRTRKALAEWDRGRLGRDDAFYRAENIGEVEAVLAVEREAVAKVQAAFLADTRDVHGEERAKAIHPDDVWLRRTVARDGMPEEGWKL